MKDGRNVSYKLEKALPEELSLSKKRKPRGRNISPKIFNIPSPFDSREMLFSNNSIVLDTAMGYGCDAAWIKMKFPDAEVHGRDIGIILNNGVKPDLSGFRYSSNEYTYGEARRIIKESLGGDYLRQCTISQGDSLNLGLYQDNYFNRVLCIGFAHILKREERNTAYREACRLLCPGGIYLVITFSGAGLEPFIALKSKYDWEEVRFNNSDGSFNEKINPEKREEFINEMSIICRDHNINPTLKEWRKLKMVASSQEVFFMEHMMPELIAHDLHSAGFNDVVVRAGKREKEAITRLVIYARK